MDVTSNNVVITKLAFPLGVGIKSPMKVPRNIVKDYNETVQVLHISENASAALARRCLDHVLSEQGFPQDLHHEARGHLDAAERRHLRVSPLQRTREGQGSLLPGHEEDWPGSGREA
jgi:hypothetical protein